MAFRDLIDNVIDLLERRGRVSYRALRREFDLTDAGLDDVKFELIDVLGLAIDQDDAILVSRRAEEPDRDRPPSAAVVEAADSSALVSTPAAGLDAERRQLTVLFCDLVGSTALSTELDPEELREVLRDYQAVCAEVIERYGGVIARQVGDGLLVNFGYPQAHDDDERRAVRAALAIVDALPELNTRVGQSYSHLRGRALEVRIGVHTGLAVVGALGASTYRDPMAVVGETPNIAARLQGLAEPNAVVVSAATHRLLGDAFVCDDLGQHELKGLAMPVTVHRVLVERDATAGGGEDTRRRTPMIGRAQEVAVLLDRWEQSKEGEGQAVLLSGEAGIGKSRLLQELAARIGDEPHAVLEGRASPFHQQSAFYPIVDLLQRGLGFESGSSADAKLAKLSDLLDRYELPPGEMLPCLARLLGVPIPSAIDTVADLPPQRRRQQTLETLLAVLLRVAARQPVLMVIEDLHWADPSTIELLGLVIQQALTSRLLLVLAARPEFRVPWGTAHLTRLTLTRLRRSQIEELTTAVCAGKPLPGEVVDQVVHKTDGVPLFVEELTKMVLESDWVREGDVRYDLTGPLPALAIPATLQDSLMARLDRLATTKVVAQIAATIGRTFSYELLHAVSGLGEAALTAELQKLSDAELLYQRGLPPDASYSFKHALIQDAAYQTLLRSTRQQYHRQVARVLETRFRSTVETHPELIAHHYTQAGLVAEALPYWQRAAERAIERSANQEGVAHLHRALELLATLPDGADRLQMELDLQMTLAPVLMATNGYAAPEVEAACRRARDLCTRVGETPRHVQALLGLATFYIIRADYHAARDLATNSLALAERRSDRPRVSQAHLALGNSLFHLGEFAAAQAYFQRAVSSEPGADAPRRRAGASPRVIGLSHIGKTLWLLGHTDRGLERNDEAVALARELAHPYTLAMASALTAWFHLLRRDDQAARDWAERGQVLCSEQGFSLWLAQGHVVRGWALARQGVHEGVDELHAGLQAWRATGAALAAPMHLTLLAEAYGLAGRRDEALVLVDEALDLVQRTGERWEEAEVHRVRGELLAMCRDDAPAAEASLRRGIDVAQSQQALAFELRAATSLGRLWQQGGQRAAARALVSSVCERFPAGFDAPDGRDARALLDAL